MKRIIVVLIGSLAFLYAAAQKTPAWVKTSVFTQIYPSSFQDSDVICKPRQELTTKSKIETSLPEPKYSYANR